MGEKAPPMIFPIPDGHHFPTTSPDFKENLVPRTGSWMVPSSLTLPKERGWLMGGHLSPRANTAPLGSTAMQMASPPATPEVADPGDGRSSVAMHGTYCNLEGNLAFNAVLDPCEQHSEKKEITKITEESIEKHQDSSTYNSLLLGREGSSTGDKGGKDRKLHFV